MQTTTSRDHDVLCAGIITVDHVCSPLRRLPVSGELVMAGHIELALGGSASNVGVDLRRLGRRVSIAGRVGDDIFGLHVCDVLRKEGADTDQVTFSTTAPTASTMVVNVQGEDRRFIHAAGANIEFTGREITHEAVRSSRAVYLGGFGLNPALSGENVAELFALAREAGVLTILDVVVGEEDVGRMLADVLPLTDLFFPNEDESRAITGLAEPAEQSRLFRDWGAGCVVVTRGACGAMLLDQDRFVSIGSHTVQQVDGTGSGDAFLAGYVHGALDGCSPEECLRYGTALGASCVQSAGATTGVLGTEELADFVRQHPLAVTPVS